MSVIDGSSSALYRGLSHSLNGASSTEDIARMAHLDWKVCGMPVLIQGKTENRLFPARKALVRCDNGHPIEIVSDRFKIHQNTEIIAGLAATAEAGGIKITHGGSTDGGANVFLHGTCNRQFDAGESKKLGDIVRLDFRMSGGHRPGRPSTLEALAMRLTCLNGATITDRTMRVRTTHRQTWNAQSTQEVAEFVENAIRSFETYEQKSKRLLGYTMSREATQTYVLELLQPQLLRAAVAKVSTAAAMQSHASILDAIMSGDSTRNVVRDLLRGKEVDGDKVGRAAKAVLAVVDTQPGAELDGVAGTAWNAYNAVTYYVDHVRGRGSDPSSAVESAISGEGARLKTRALDLAVEYAMGSASVV